MFKRTDFGQYQHHKKERLNILECPFTWHMEEIVHDESFKYEKGEKYYDNNKEEVFPLLGLMSLIMKIYLDVKLKNNQRQIFNDLDKCQQYISIIRKRDHPQISVDFANYVFQATLCHVYHELGMWNIETEKILRVIEFISVFDRKDKSTLKACQGICWSIYHKNYPLKAQKFMKDAIQLNPECDLWHFLLASNLRRQRRTESINSMPSEEEKYHFECAYNMNPKNMVYKTFVAQMFKEMRKEHKAKEILEELYESKPKDNLILLRLAHNFMSYQDLEKADDCLKEVEKNNFKDSMYYHYKANFYKKLQMFKEAILFYEKAKESHNLSAEVQCLECLLKTDKEFSITDYLQKILKKYKYLPERRLQSLYLDLAFCKWKYESDVYKAVIYFLQALKIDSKAKCLTKYHNYLKITDDVNIFNVLRSQFLPILDEKKYTFKKNFLKKVNLLASYCYNSEHDKVNGKFIVHQKICKKPTRPNPYRLQSTSKKCKNRCTKKIRRNRVQPWINISSQKKIVKRTNFA